VLKQPPAAGYGISPGRGRPRKRSPGSGCSCRSR
jgi:hypothetical protein